MLVVAVGCRTTSPSTVQSTSALTDTYANTHGEECCNRALDDDGSPVFNAPPAGKKYAIFTLTAQDMTYPGRAVELVSEINKLGLKATIFLGGHALFSQFQDEYRCKPGALWIDSDDDQRREDFKKLFRAIVDGGHEVGTHGFNHLHPNENVCDEGWRWETLGVKRVGMQPSNSFIRTALRLRARCRRCGEDLTAKVLTKRAKSRPKPAFPFSLARIYR